MLKKILAAILAVSLCLSVFAGCGGRFDENEIEFVVHGSDYEVSTYTAMVDAFNDTYGKEHGIKAYITRKNSGGYNTYIQTTASTKSGPDVYLIVEDNFKRDVNAGMIGEIEAEFNAVTDIDVSDIYPIMTNRLRYNKYNNTSDASDPIYGLPIDTKPTAIFYNESLFEEAGIITISVDEENIEAWNNNKIPDNRGKYKRDFPQLEGVTVPAKGYYRSRRPYVTYGDVKIPWSVPSPDEVLVFNNRIAMNWDEVEDIAMLFTPQYNSAARNFGNELFGKTEGTQFGYFTEWWFNYGWSVGGDCLEDLSGNGDWNFSLLDPNTNYIVNEGKTYTGLYTGKTYTAGETLEFTDKMNVPAGELLVADGEGGYTYNGQAVGNREGLDALIADGTLSELPSTREAFTRYLKLGTSTEASFDGEAGLDISPNPNLFTGGNTAVNYFIDGNMPMLVTYSIYMTSISDYLGNNKVGTESRPVKWDVAPLVVYKEYTDPTDPQCDEVKVKGKTAGHSNSTAMVVRARSPKKKAAAAFIKWMASKEGQSVRVSEGFFPNQASLLDQIEFPTYSAPSNVRVFSEALEFQGAGDWWYMSDYEWINVWAVPLNTYVRNDRLDFVEWYTEAIPDTNEKLKDDNYKYHEE